MSDELFQNFSTVQSDQQPQPATIASAATIAPSTFITFVSGTTDIATVTPPVTGAHMLVTIFTNASPPDYLTTGNIKGGYTTITQYVPVVLFYNPIEAKYYPAGF